MLSPPCFIHTWNGKPQLSGESPHGFSGPVEWGSRTSHHYSITYRNTKEKQHWASGGTWKRKDGDSPTAYLTGLCKRQVHLGGQRWRVGSFTKKTHQCSCDLRCGFMAGAERHAPCTWHLVKRCLFSDPVSKNQKKLIGFSWAGQKPRTEQSQSQTVLWTKFFLKILQYLTDWLTPSHRGSCFVFNHTYAQTQ